MSKQKSKSQDAADSKGKPDDQNAAAAKKPQRKDGMRETVESVVVAFVLAFLFRAFEAEAFVIPTGSMAPTLYGRHKDVTCEKCKFYFTVGASDEVNSSTGVLETRLETALCPNCRFENQIRKAAVFKGDRILVNKFPYEFGDPHRWDVAVFKYPEEPKTNYIKRLVGLPGETIIISRGDLYRLEENGERQILRKSAPNKQRELQIAVYDNDYPETELHANGWPYRWAAVSRSDAVGDIDAGDGVRDDDQPSDTADGKYSKPIAGWSDTEDGWIADRENHSFHLELDKSKSKQLQWIRYRHIVPSPSDWSAIKYGDEPQPDFPLQPETIDPRPQLISDFCGYNSYTGGRQGELYRDVYWVGDLTVAFQVELSDVGESGELVIELNEAARRYRCRINVVTGKATLATLVEHNRDADEESVIASADTSLKGTGTFKVRFANVDNRLCLWVDRKLIDFGSRAEYEIPRTANPSPQEEDLIPVGIAAHGISASVSHLALERDIYYRSEHVIRADDYQPNPDLQSESSSEMSLRRSLSDPDEWYQLYSENMAEAQLPLGEDEFLMLGDNSPRSRDSRLWPNMRRAVHRQAVPRSLLVGKAFFIYWPHGIPFLNDGEGYTVGYHQANPHHGDTEQTRYPKTRIPFYPNFGRMHRIR